jgi:hypothetical protein
MASAMNNELIGQALDAAGEAARCLGAGHVDPLLLHHSHHISVLLPPVATVARMLVCTEEDVVERLSRELAIARHLSERQAPIVVPSSRYPAGPHFYGKFALTLWQFVEHIPANGDDRAHVASAAAALRCVHDGLADYPGQLPSFMVKIGKCRALLQRPSALPGLAAADRRFLLAVYDRILASLQAMPLTLVPIHGDAGPHNVLMTSEGARYGDFEDISLGPREWDVGWLPDADLSAFEPINRDLLSSLADLRSLCVSVWCWAEYGMPEKKEAAEYHLEYLKDRFG